MKKIDSIKKKIIYRAEYRGIKEMDILLSSFVKKYVETLNYQDLEDLYEILKIDIAKTKTNKTLIKFIFINI